MKPRLTFVVLLSLALYQLLPGQTAQKKRPSGPVASSPQEIAETIQRLEGELRVAIMKADSGWFESHLAEHYAETDDQGKVRNRQEVIEFYRTTVPEYDMWNLSEGSAQTYNGNSVILTGKIELEGTIRSQHVSGSFRFTRVWIKQGMDWQLAASQFTRIAA